jgi:hypothetical protein
MFELAKLKCFSPLHLFPDLNGSSLWKKSFIKMNQNIGCSFKFILKVGVGRSIVNAPLVCRIKTQTTQKVRLYLNSWSVICNPWCVHNRLINSNFEEKFFLRKNPRFWHRFIDSDSYSNQWRRKEREGQLK